MHSIEACIEIARPHGNDAHHGLVESLGETPQRGRRPGRGTEVAYRAQQLGGQRIDQLRNVRARVAPRFELQQDVLEAHAAEVGSVAERLRLAWTCHRVTED